MKISEVKDKVTVMMRQYIMTKENILPELNFPFVEEMKQFSTPFFPDRKENMMRGNGICKQIFRMKKRYWIRLTDTAAAV